MQRSSVWFVVLAAGAAISNTLPAVAERCFGADIVEVAAYANLAAMVAMFSVAVRMAWKLGGAPR